MIRKPCTDLSLKSLGFLIFASLFLANPAALLATEEIHSLKIERAEKTIYKDQPVRFVVKAYREDGSHMASANSNLTLWVNERFIKHPLTKIQLENGRAEFTRTFSDAGSALIQVVDLKDKEDDLDNLIASDMFRVQVAPRGEVK